MLSLLGSAILLALLFAWVAGPDQAFKPARLRDILAGVPAGTYLLYALLHLAGIVFRALRFRLLLRAGGEAHVPGLARILLVTGVRNMVVDLLPARLGELAYVGMMNRGYRVQLETCLSSLAVSIWLDILVLVPVIAALLLLAGAPGTVRLPAVSVIPVLIAASLAGYLVLFHGVAQIQKLAGRLGPAGGGSRLRRGAGAMLASLAVALEHTRDWRVLAHGLLLSVGVRACKYTGLMLLFLAVAASAGNSLVQAAPTAVLAALVASEAAASLPIPAFMSFGTYEAGGTAAFAALGFPAAESAGIMLTTHAATQLLDYSIGLACLALYFVSVRSAGRS